MICYGPFLNGLNLRRKELDADARYLTPALGNRGPRQSLDRAGGAVRGVLDDHPRPDDRERGAPDDPTRPALLAVGAGMGRERIPDRVRRAAPARRPAR